MSLRKQQTNSEDGNCIMESLRKGICWTLLMLVLMAGALQGSESAREASERIKDRLDQIDDWKVRGLVGETAEGYLAARKALNARQQAVLQAENRDRKIIYEAVAAQTGRTVEEVARQRALSIAERARAGTWLRNSDGAWYQKT